MNRKDLIDRLQELYKDEDSRVTVNPHAGQKVAIVYPNTYFVGMSNLGLHIIYEEINLRNDSVCERIFLPEKKELEAYDKTKTPPEPFADFIDAFIIGEGEGIVSRVLDIIRDGKMEGLDRHAILRQLADVSGVYVPSLYVPIYNEDGEFKGYDIAEGVPKTIKRHFEMLTSGGETVVATN
ncbi:MAG: B12-binding domain-containing radical SAM protein, partial [Veillonella sp.]|nr:B12-binding domain-containing radical SAM protein [Veillonella sp.]